MYHFEAASPILFIKREIFNILVSERRFRQRDICSKVNLVRDFDTGDILLVRKQVNSNINYRVYHKLALKTKGPYRLLEKSTPSSYWV